MLSSLTPTHLHLNNNKQALKTICWCPHFSLVYLHQEKSQKQGEVRRARNPWQEQGLIDEYPLPDPTRTFFLLPEPDPNYFSKFPSLGFFPAGCFPAGRFKSFNNNPQILLFSSRSDTKSSVQLIYDALHFTSRIKLDQDLGWESF